VHPFVEEAAMTRALQALFAVFVGLLLGGCATSRSEIALASPAATPAASSGKPIVIRSVKDERVFEQAPREPSTPSLGFEGSVQASAETKARAVGRKRNTYGQALGDVLLQPGQTIQAVVRENLASALQQSGYRVVSEAEAGPSSPVMDVRVRKFWSWIQPGFWAITLHTAIATDLQISGSRAPYIVEVKSSEGLQVASDGNWIEAVGKALAAYRAEAAKVLSAR
jgi:hypothetical protein